MDTRQDTPVVGAVQGIGVQSSKTCIVCRTEFVSRRPTQQMCSVKCRAVKQKQDATRQCQHCEKAFIPKASDRATYCSRDCAYAARRKRAETRVTPQRAVVTTNCTHCKREFVQTRSDTHCCSAECKRAENRNKDRIAKQVKNDVRIETVCQMCRNVIPEAIRHGSRMYCSERCAEKAYRKKRNATINTAQRRRRTRLRDATVEEVSPATVFNRDGWTCWLCSLPVDPKAAIPMPACPTLDHVIPLSKGGEHSYQNVRCACFACNSKKRDLIL